MKRMFNAPARWAAPVLALMLAAVTPLAGPAVAEAQVEEVLKQERRGLIGVKGGLLDRLFNPKKARPRSTIRAALLMVCPRPKVTKNGPVWPKRCTLRRAAKA